MISITYFSKHGRKHGDEFEAHYIQYSTTMAPFCRKKSDSRRRSQLEKQRRRQRLCRFVRERSRRRRLFFSVDYGASKTGEQHEL